MTSSRTRMKTEIMLKIPAMPGSFAFNKYGIFVEALQIFSWISYLTYQRKMVKYQRRDVLEVIS